MYFAGIDIGSTVTKVVIVNEDGETRSVGIGRTGAEHRQEARQVMDKALKQMGLPFEEIDYIVATGYGRVSIPFADRQMTELTCHARGVSSLFPRVRTAIDIGGQDAKAFKVKQGKMVDFVMNDKCAAGTGRFLEMTANTLGLDVADLGSISLRSLNKIEIGSTCSIFAQQEIISHLSQGTSLADILAGLHTAIVSRVARIVQRLKIEPEVVLTGGVARNVGIVKAMKENLGREIFVPDDPLITGALGAALLGREFTLKALDNNEPVRTGDRLLTKG